MYPKNNENENLFVSGGGQIVMLGKSIKARSMKLVQGADPSSREQYLSAKYEVPRKVSYVSSSLAGEINKCWTQVFAGERIETAQL